MKKIIHHLRRQPEEVRRHFLHIFTGVVAVIMLLLWVFSLGKSVGSSETKAKIQQDLKPFSALRDNMVGGYNSMGDPEPAVVE